MRPRTVLDALASLYDKSLLVVDRDTGSPAGPRYRMLETVRQYARARLDASGEADMARARHAAHFLRLAEAAEPHMGGPQESDWLERLHAEHEDLAAAMSWCAEDGSPADPSWAVRLAAASNQYWLFNEVELGCRLALAALGRAGTEADSAARFRVLRGLARMYMHRGQGEAGLPHARAALDLAQRVGNAEWQAAALNAVGPASAAPATSRAADSTTSRRATSRRQAAARSRWRPR
jgi:hypothetical protein